MMTARQKRSRVKYRVQDALEPSFCLIAQKIDTNTRKRIRASALQIENTCEGIFFSPERYWSRGRVCMRP